jgi:uncharacterized protein (TIGR04551 family)
MSRALLAAVAVIVAVPSLARAQDAGASLPPTSPAGASSAEFERLQKDYDKKLEAARREVKDLREEMRAQLATKSIAGGWQEEWNTKKRSLELFTFDGYFRVRPELFNKFDLNRAPDSSGHTLWPRSHTSSTPAERTNAGVNMRLRFEPTLNVSEDIRIRTQVDVFDNLVWGTTPDYAFSRDPSRVYDRNDFSVFSSSQVSPQAGLNALSSSINVKRVWGEVATPVGIVRFGRMGSHWGLGLLHNDGNGIDSDYGDTVDRVTFVSQPLAGFYITPMIDFNLEGPTTPPQTGGGQPVDLSNLDDATSFAIAIARHDTEPEKKAKLESAQTVLDYGIHFEYRTQRKDSLSFLNGVFQSPSPAKDTVGWVVRDAALFMPDLWARAERKSWRVEAEAAAVMGWVNNRSLTMEDNNTPGEKNLVFWQFGAVLQGEYKFLNGDLEVGGEIGFASGDKDPGFGNYPARKGSGRNGSAGYGDLDGPQYDCDAVSCSSGGNAVRNFRFNRDYRVDMILYRELLGGVTDSFYLKPRARYRITQGFYVFGSAIYSRAIYGESTPSVAVQNDGSIKSDPNLGLELNAGVSWETEDGLFAKVQYGILFPLPGLSSGTSTLDNAQAVRGAVGIRF